MKWVLPKKSFHGGGGFIIFQRFTLGYFLFYPLHKVFTHGQSSISPPGHEHLVLGSYFLAVTIWIYSTLPCLIVGGSTLHEKSIKKGGVMIKVTGVI